MEYLGIEAIGLLEETDPMRWNNQKNPDNFFRNVYYYYENHGLPAIILSQVCLTFSLAFTIGLSIFMIAFINWNGIINCSDEETCSADDFVKNPFNQSPSSFMFFTVIYFVLFGSLWTYKTFLALKVIKNAIEMEQFYREILGIKLNELLVMKWHEVIDRIILLHENNSYRVTMKDKLTPHDIASYIMRKDNYLIALINRSLLDLRVPWFLLPFMSEELFLTESLEVSLSFCIFEYMFTDQYDISHDFINDIEGMKWRFQAVGIMNLLLLPFMLVYLVLQFFLSNAQQFHTSRTYLGPRQWSPLALLKFREFNELPHIFRERMNGSVLPANSYLSNFRNYYIETIAKTCMFITGAFLSMLLLSSFLSGEVLLHGHIGEHNLLWFLGIFTAIYAGANSFMPDESKQPEDSEMLMQKICSHTHYYPDHWVGKAKTWDVRDEFCELFQYKASLFFMEIMSSILTPIILCFSLPSSSAVVLEFIRYVQRSLPIVLLALILSINIVEIIVSTWKE